MQELRQTISREGEAAESCEAKTAKKDKMRLVNAVKRGGNVRRDPDAKVRKDSRNCKADDLQEMITALCSQLSHVKAQTAFLALKCSEMRPDDQVSLYGFMDAQEQLKIEKSLLAGHAYIVRQILAKRKQTTSPEIRRILREIEMSAYCRSWPELSSS